ncbi:DUF3325 domain-containing protein [Cupriavidus sp. AU9028]|uniref:DUF3325 domain-containing protein n=1 Tax=Cupriavidus sp. AU9028 TaxID=2871157 RepID=UPI001C97F021|nr:DUF3325 domain-containing protein [Cupriavidus sp. AU9028]MBY4899213.1 DUF3325 domain-containing protein [Cupriavidus sp. AU9028]
MSPGFALIAGFALAFSGFTALALTIDRHYADIHGRGREPSPRLARRLHVLGWSALLLCWLTQADAQGWPVGTVYWIGVMTAAALAVVAVLGWMPLRATPLAKASAAVGVLLLAFMRFSL